MLIGAELTEFQRSEFKAYLQFKKGVIQRGRDFKREMGDDPCHSFRNNTLNTKH